MTHASTPPARYIKVLHCSSCLALTPRPLPPSLLRRCARPSPLALARRIRMEKVPFAYGGSGHVFMGSLGCEKGIARSKRVPCAIKCLHAQLMTPMVSRPPSRPAPAARRTRQCPVPSALCLVSSARTSVHERMHARTIISPVVLLTCCPRGYSFPLHPPPTAHRPPPTPRPRP